jgi:hypothetical protein
MTDGVVQADRRARGRRTGPVSTSTRRFPRADPEHPPAGAGGSVAADLRSTRPTLDRGSPRWPRRTNPTKLSRRSPSTATWASSASPSGKRSNPPGGWEGPPDPQRSGRGNPALSVARQTFSCERSHGTRYVGLVGGQGGAMGEDPRYRGRGAGRASPAH